MGGDREKRGSSPPSPRLKSRHFRALRAAVPFAEKECRAERRNGLGRRTGATHSPRGGSGRAAFPSTPTQVERTKTSPCPALRRDNVPGRREDLPARPPAACKQSHPGCATGTERGAAPGAETPQGERSVEPDAMLSHTAGQPPPPRLLFSTCSRSARSSSSSRWSLPARSSAPSACSCRLRIFLRTASSELNPAAIGKEGGGEQGKKGGRQRRAMQCNCSALHLLHRAGAYSSPLPSFLALCDAPPPASLPPEVLRLHLSASPAPLQQPPALAAAGRRAVIAATAAAASSIHRERVRGRPRQQRCSGRGARLPAVTSGDGNKVPSAAVGRKTPPSPFLSYHPGLEELPGWP